jgi:CoA:oxalate CoA-transferase
MSSKPNSLLSGIRVLDFTAFVAGPYCTRLMADLGADVVKIEPPHGDLLRHVAPVRSGHSTYFGQLNLGKRSLSIDIKKPQGLNTVKLLAQKADVIIENFRPGIVKKFGLDYQTLTKQMPSLIYCSISGYGQTGPASQEPAFAPIIHAASGFDMAQTQYQNGSTAPARGRPVAADVLAAVHSLSAINAALFRRERTGTGEYIDIALMECIYSLLPFEFQQTYVPDSEAKVPIYAPIETLDGYILIAPVTQKNFKGLAKALNQDNWLCDPRFAESKQRYSNLNIIYDAVGKWAAQLTSVQCERALRPSGCPFSVYRTISEALEDPQVKARQGVVEGSDAAGTFKVPNTPLRLTRSTSAIGAKVPYLGQDNTEVLTEWLNFDADALQALEKEKSLHTSH